MEERIYEGKEQKEVLASALEELNLTENDVMYYFSKEKAGLLKKEVIKLHLFEGQKEITFIQFSHFNKHDSQTLCSHKRISTKLFL